MPSVRIIHPSLQRAGRGLWGAPFASSGAVSATICRRPSNDFEAKNLFPNKASWKPPHVKEKTLALLLTLGVCGHSREKQAGAAAPSPTPASRAPTSQLQSKEVDEDAGPEADPLPNQMQTPPVLVLQLVQPMLGCPPEGHSLAEQKGPTARVGQELSSVSVTHTAH